ncbi:putative amino-acid permease protein YxeN [Marinomonas spartinae]|uniref:Putative amino-acid permease protein YxeN n=1 Tax=Marinomonas spartinae TaxID=1792290 RepID=A0A1A8TNP4_9GAMM|nr:ectoine/hydroxyectoine ABC transporter permease subunit EhuD [Marinomonas spartinae]SBS34598.1 putative amino-acid permease protein YxeN [Marinomonas spartinae]SBS38191.1 putative amino-acid permease protein YxeN [Marinomonas spartinae]
MNGFSWDWAFAWEVLPMILSAAKVTLLATLLGSIFAIFMGLVFALLRRSPSRILRNSIYWLVEFIRSTPLLVQIFFLYYVMPEFGISMSPLMTGVFALGLHYGAYLSEVFRSGIDGIEKGQWEAARALNLTTIDTYKDIVLPQAIRPMIPATGNYIIAMFKETPQLSAITLLEMLQVAKIIGSENFRYLEPFTLVGILYLVFSIVAAFGIHQVEKRFPKEGFTLK